LKYNLFLYFLSVPLICALVLLRIC